MDYAQKIILKLLEEYSQEELAEILDDKQPNISAFKNGSRKVSKKAKLILSEKFGYDLNKLNSSSDDFLSHLPDPAPKENTTPKEALKTLSKIQNGKNKNSGEGKVLASGDMLMIKTYVIPMKGFAGLKNAIYDDQYITDHFEETTTEVPHHLYSPISYRIQSSGNSMPKSIPQNAWVTGVPIAEMLWLDYKFKPDKIYVLFHPYRGILFKHVKNLTKNEIQLYSENDDKNEYPDEIFKITDFRKILLAIKVEIFI
ncbi:MAG: helix-turn-helix transcriptional regulator [Myroides sp.]